MNNLYIEIYKMAERIIECGLNNNNNQQLWIGGSLKAWLQTTFSVKTKFYLKAWMITTLSLQKSFL